ncbi:hypothetical protein [Variovorax guangxiensis]|uniref:hypothetical protein n=1 Tax=Variovorax guangxiensis TaxID=1775474 RepID=UPI00285FB9D2|nr:hypothetical protein [Variovorax guangxiensis]MDR6859882.1 hypothetical protein [Variovorax guangxiensis]
MHDTGQPRFFVTVLAKGPDELRQLQAHGMDLFAPTARRQKGRAARPFAIEGLLDREEIAKLEGAGYEVKVDAPMEERSIKPGDTLELEDWLARTRTHVAKDGLVK